MTEQEEANAEDTVLEGSAGPSQPADTIRAPGGDETVLSESQSAAAPDETVLASAAPGVTVAEPAEVAAAEKAVAAEWAEGDVILDLYEVAGLLGEGGMGKVYRVRHRGWNLDLAVKSPRADYFQTEEQKQNFVRECETWIDLGLHPHTVSCYYVRTLGGIPRVFAEYVEGGSLSDWIESGKLYDGGAEAALKRMLDVAIQFAWGLGYAHERGLIHQDVKPANVMLTPEGEAKVTDFGLAQARPVGEVEVADGKGGTVMVKGRGMMTPAYCSPEQASGEELSRKTDIWSWAVSVLELFTGERTWEHGQAASLVLGSYLEAEQAEARIPRMPQQVEELLRQCFAREPSERPKDMQAVVERLRECYNAVVGEEHARPEPKPAELLADALNNRAVSLLDLGKREEAERLFDEALESDPHHAEAVYNRGLVLWRTGRLTDDALVTQLEEMRTSHQADWRDEYYLGLVHIERGDPDAALAALDQAQLHAEDAPEFEAAKAIVGNEARIWCDQGDPLLGHTGRILAVAALPAGHRAVSAGKDGTVRVWDVEAGTLECTLSGNTGRISAVAAMPDGRHVVSGGVDGSVRVWDVEAEREVGRFQGHVGAVNSVAVFPTGRHVASGGNDATVRVWDAETRREVGRFEGHAGAVNSVAVFPGRPRLLSGGTDGIVRVWDLASGTLERALEGHVGAVSSVAVSPDGSCVVSGGEDGTIRVGSASSMGLAITLRGHTGAVSSVGVSSDGSRVVSGGCDRTVRLWDTVSGSVIRTLEGHSEAVNGVALSPSADLGVSAGDDMAVRTWRFGFGPRGTFAVARPRAGREVLEATARACAALAEARQALADGRPNDAASIVVEARKLSGFERSADLLNVLADAGRLGRRSALAGAWAVGTLEGHSGPVVTVAAGLDGPTVVSGGNDGTVRVWDTNSGKPLRTVGDYEGAIRAVAVAPDGQQVVFAGDNGAVATWDSTQDTPSRLMEGHAGAVHAAVVSPDGRWLASAGDDMVVRVWDAASGKLLRTLEGHADTVRVLAAAPDGRRLASGGDDETLRVWEVASGALVRTIEAHTRWVDADYQLPDGRVAIPRRGVRHLESVGTAAYTRDGLVVFTGSGEGLVRMWDAASGELLRTFETGAGAVRGVAATPDGRWVASAGEDGAVLVWDVRSGAPIRTLRGHAGAANAVAIDPEGRTVVSGGNDGAVRAWRLDWDYEFPDIADWDERARPHLENFLRLRARSQLMSGAVERDPKSARPAKPWLENDFDTLLAILSYCGFGWLRPAGVRSVLEEMMARRD